MNDWVIETGDRDFDSAVLERSHQVPVVVDFWAPWCAPCRALGPLLERLAAEHNGEFVLAKVNVDDNPRLAADMRVASIPMVLGLRDGAVVAEFVGALPESAVRQFLTRVLPSDAERLARAADAALTAGKADDAEVAYRRALALDARCAPALVGLARLLAARGDDDGALELLDRVLPGSLRAEADRLAAQIRVRQGGGGDEHTLRAKLAADPRDHAARMQLGQWLAAAGRHDEALAEYLEVVRRDRTYNDGAARKAMLDIFELLGSEHELTNRYRSELAKVLFS